MPFALVPDGFKLQKVTKQQKEAVDKHSSNEAVQAFFDGPASGELVKGVVIVVTPFILTFLAKKGYEYTKEEIDDFIGGVFNLIPELPGGALKETIIESIDLSALSKFSP